MFPIAGATAPKVKPPANAAPLFQGRSLIPGAIPLARLEEEINKGETEAKKLAAVKK